MADFIGDSNIINGLMIRDELVEILGVKFVCVDKDFGNYKPVDVVIRPEDVNLYEGYFDGLKLATRVNRNPTAVAEAYFTGCCHGNLPDLLEPAHAEAFYPEILENSLLPADFGEHTLHCSHDCRNCSYCRTALEGALVNLNDWNHQHEKRR